MITEIVRRLREACTGGIHCQCSYRLAADEIERLQADCEMWQRQSGEHADQIKTLVTEVTGLQRENAALRADAERYRWLRDLGDETWVPWSTRPIGWTDAEKYIDAAIAARGAKE